MIRRERSMNRKFYCLEFMKAAREPVLESVARMAVADKVAYHCQCGSLAHQAQHSHVAI